MPVLTVTDRDGSVRAVEMKPQGDLMLALREAGYHIRAECGGACACGTCHIYVDESSFAKLPPAAELETEMVSFLLESKPTSRLACQVKVEDTPDGMSLTIAPEE
ncbi:2Fe-2S iron-sulfur cluster-binding protein [Actibacterium sp. D379-3]